MNVKCCLNLFVSLSVCVHICIRTFCFFFSGRVLRVQAHIIWFLPVTSSSSYFYYRSRPVPSSVSSSWGWRLLLHLFLGRSICYCVCHWVNDLWQCIPICFRPFDLCVYSILFSSAALTHVFRFTFLSNVFVPLCV